MSIHKSQGQTINFLEVYLSKPVFSHGQFYVACLRVTTYQNLRLFLGPASSELLNCTKNIITQGIKVLLHYFSSKIKEFSIIITS
ncbi:39542_t:CDS:2 [Gigaspora margarita]|uniref:39542_t:CDS:1 n=1 Tax=Gigaspora margarita TaxID=4874 RepID=A0ABN7V414_GIGMA|nr:39542_t:CDS:2 [Gigaspora margarita]